MIDKKINNEYVGRSEWDAPEVDCKVYISEQEDIKIGQFYTTKITAFQDIDLRGKVKSI